MTLGVLLGAAIAAPVYADPVTCEDGTTSESGRGACSHHGGVAKKADTRTEDTDAPVRTRAHTKPAPVDRDADRDSAHDRDRDSEPMERSEKPEAAPRERAPLAPRADQDAPASARCKDGHISHSRHHSGTCSGHGGVASWLED